MGKKEDIKLDLSKDSHEKNTNGFVRRAMSISTAITGDHDDMKIKPLPTPRTSL